MQASTMRSPCPCPWQPSSSASDLISARCDLQSSQPMDREQEKVAAIQDRDRQQVEDCKRYAQLAGQIDVVDDRQLGRLHGGAEHGPRTADVLRDLAAPHQPPQEHELVS